MNITLLQNNIDSLIAEGKHVVSTEFDAGVRGVGYPLGRPRGVDLQAFARWQAGCLSLLRMLGDAGEQWKPDFAGKQDKPAAAKRMLGTLEGIANAINDGMLIKVEDLVRAEAFENLLGQADYLLSEGYFLAAGVLGRAVLEQHLNNWCQIAACSPTKTRPTLNDFKDGLYKSKQINVTQMKHIESLASVGNDAAHNNPTLRQTDVERLLRDVRDILVKYPLSSV